MRSALHAHMKKGCRDLFGGFGRFRVAAAKKRNGHENTKSNPAQVLAGPSSKCRGSQPGRRTSQGAKALQPALQQRLCHRRLPARLWMQQPKVSPREHQRLSAAARGWSPEMAVPQGRLRTSRLPHQWSSPRPVKVEHSEEKTRCRWRRSGKCTVSKRFCSTRMWELPGLERQRQWRRIGTVCTSQQGITCSPDDRQISNRATFPPAAPAAPRREPAPRESMV
jgi:hypothetical protein